MRIDNIAKKHTAKIKRQTVWKKRGKNEQRTKIEQKLTANRTIKQKHKL